MTYTAFKTHVAAFLNRPEASFVNGSADLLARAIHKARLWAQRNHDFEYCRMAAQLTVSVTNGASLASVKDASDLSKAVAVKKIERAFLPLNDGSGSFPIELSTRPRHMEILRKRYEEQTNLDPTLTPSGITPTRFKLVQQGQMVYLSPPDATALGGSSVSVGLDVVRWLPDYTADLGAWPSDFFLDYGEDFLLFRSASELNFFLKQDIRVSISKAALDDAWASLVAWDETIVGRGTDENSLD